MQQRITIIPKLEELLAEIIRLPPDILMEIFDYFNISFALEMQSLFEKNGTVVSIDILLKPSRYSERVKLLEQEIRTIKELKPFDQENEENKEFVLERVPAIIHLYQHRIEMLDYFFNFMLMENENNSCLSGRLIHVDDVEKSNEIYLALHKYSASYSFWAIAVILWFLMSQLNLNSINFMKLKQDSGEDKSLLNSLFLLAYLGPCIMIYLNSDSLARLRLEGRPRFNYHRLSFFSERSQKIAKRIQGECKHMDPVPVVDHPLHKPNKSGRKECHIFQQEKIDDMLLWDLREEGYYAKSYFTKEIKFFKTLLKTATVSQSEELSENKGENDLRRLAKAPAASLPSKQC